MPKRFQLSRRKPWKTPNTVSCARPSKWGNPFRVERSKFTGEWLLDGPYIQRAYDTRDEAIRVAVDSFRRSLLCRALSYTVEDVQRELRGKDLGCWCPLPKEVERDVCHAAVLLEIANEGGGEHGF